MHSQKYAPKTPDDSQHLSPQLIPLTCGATVVLPEHPLARSSIGLDLGGSLCKICYFERFPSPLDNAQETKFRTIARQLMASPASYGSTGHFDEELSVVSERLGGTFFFMRFETRRMESFLQMVQSAKELELDSSIVVCSTGGGARKYSSQIKDVFHQDVPRADELLSLVRGINILLYEQPQELFRVDHASYRDTGDMLTVRHTAPQPYLLVNIGSGVSILRVNVDGSNQRVGGTSLGGATFFGLCSKMTGCKNFSEALALAEHGKAANVDLLVSDIYGGDYSEYNLPGATVAASLGKLIRPEDCSNACREDLARGVLDAITNNIGSLALLHAKVENVPNVVFAGSFLRGNKISVARLSYAMHYWSQGAREALFLRHEGYVGAFGALIFGSERFDRAQTTAAVSTAASAHTV